MSMYPNQYEGVEPVVDMTNLDKVVMKVWIDKNCPEILNQVSTVYVEVPVEKIVEKEVIREVPVEVINHLDEEKIELLSAILEQSKNILNTGKEPRAIYYA